MNTIPTNPLSTRMRWRNTYLRWSNCLRLWRTHNYFKKLAFLVFHTSDFATVAEKVSCGSLLSFAFKVCFVDVVRNLWRQSGTYTPTLTYKIVGNNFLKNSLHVHVHVSFKIQFSFNKTGPRMRSTEVWKCLGFLYVMSCWDIIEW